ncbi:MAG: NeuD/PglB/VioB family sugar acetyltransferase [Bacteroidota bacterium]
MVSIDMDNMLLLGGGGHGSVVAATARALGYKLVGFADRSAARVPYADAVWLGDAEPTQLRQQLPAGVSVANGFGYIGQGILRAAQYKQWLAEGFAFPALIHPHAIVAEQVEIEAGAQIMAGAVVQHQARVGQNVIVNTGAVIEHGCVVEAHAHVASGSVLSGEVHVGRGCHVGAGATVIQGVQLGAGSVIGAGSVVVRDVAPYTRVLGVPAHHTVKVLPKRHFD